MSKWRFLTLLVLFLVAATEAHAGPLGSGMGFLKTELGNVIHKASTPLGAVCTVIGGSRSAMAAAHGKEFTYPLMAAIAGVAIIAGL